MNSTQPGPQRPVATATIVPAVTSVLALAIAFGAPIDKAQENAILGVALTAVAVLQVVLGWWANRHTTPLADPRDNNGVPLVKVTDPR